MRRLGLPLAIFVTLILSVSAREKSPDRGHPQDLRPASPKAVLQAAAGTEDTRETAGRKREETPAADRRFRRLPDRGFWARGGGGILVRGDDRGVEISALSRSGPPWRLGLGVSRLGRGDSLQALRPGSPGVQGDGLEIGRNGLREWYRSADAGIEYGFRVEHPPVAGPGYGPLKIDVSVAGGLGVAADGCDGCVTFLDFLGRVALQGARIRSTDAAGMDLPTDVVLRDGVIELQIDDAGALFPIQVDSTLTAPAEVLSGETAGDGFGASAAAAGDINGDGYGDIIVGAPGHDNGGFAYGRAYLFAGSAEGIGTEPSWTVEGSSPGHGFAGVVAGAGDLNGDGFGDVVVSGVGRAYVYFGSPAGLSSVPDWISPAPEGPSGYNLTVAGAGDVNGDGFSDLLVGGPDRSVSAYVPGRADLYLGSASGPGPAPAWTSTGDQPGAWFGYSLAAAGDVNADGYGDVLVGEPEYDYPEPIDRPNAGKVLVYLGSPSGLSTVPVWESGLVNRFAFLGSSVSGAGDVNGDGFDDILMGGYNGFGGERGIARVYLGSSSGPAASPAWTRVGDHLLAHLGTTVAGAGDLNRDGYADVVIGEPDYDRNSDVSGTEESVGRAYVFRGSAAGLEVDPSWFSEGDVPFVMLGNAVGSAGDVNGDGTGDLLVGAPTDGRAMGRVFVHAGAPDNRPPVARINAPAQVECTSPAGGPVSLSGSDSTDPDSTPGTRDDIRTFEWFEHYGGPGQALLGTGETLFVTLPVADHLVTMRVTDASGATGTAEALVRVADTAPPGITLRLSPSQIWPPSHRMIPIHATVVLSDLCSGSSATLLSVVSDEPDDASGTADGSTLKDIQDASPGTADFDFKVRAERSDAGDGRVYLVTYRAVDDAGNSSASAALVTVPLSLKGLGGSSGPQQLKQKETRLFPAYRPDR